MREDEIYLRTKEWLLDQGFFILGGQPPNGTDRFPVIEIKSEESSEKGSRASYKPDLIVATQDVLLVIECKPQFDLRDVTKLHEISQSKKRLKALVDELRQRRSLDRPKHPMAQLSDNELAKRIKFCVAYSGEHHPTPKIYSLVFSSDGSTSTLYFGDFIAESISN